MSQLGLSATGSPRRGPLVVSKADIGLDWTSGRRFAVGQTLDWTLKENYAAGTRHRANKNQHLIIYKYSKSLRALRETSHNYGEFSSLQYSGTSGTNVFVKNSMTSSSCLSFPGGRSALSSPNVPPIRSNISGVIVTSAGKNGVVLRSSQSPITVSYFTSEIFQREQKQIDKLFHRLLIFGVPPKVIYGPDVHMVQHRIFVVVGWDHVLESSRADTAKFPIKQMGPAIIQQDPSLHG